MYNSDMIDLRPIHNSLQMLKAGVKPHDYHNRSIRGYRKAFFYISIWAWRALVLTVAVWTIIKLTSLI